MSYTGYVKDKNILHVFDTENTIKYLECHLNDISFISKIKIYLSEVTQYYDADRNDYLIHSGSAPWELINYIYSSKDNNFNKRITLVVCKKCESMVELAKRVCKNCKYEGYPEPYIEYLDGIGGYWWGIDYQFATDCGEQPYNSSLNATLTSAGPLYIVESNRRRRSSKGHYVIPNLYDISNKPIVVAEDYCKWYDLLICDENGKLVDSIDYNNGIFYNELEWWDHAVKPVSVVKGCIKASLRLDMISYLAICYRWAEDREYDTPDCIPDEELPYREDLEKVIEFNKGVCEYFHLPYTLGGPNIRYSLSTMVKAE